MQHSNLQASNLFINIPGPSSGVLGPGSTWKYWGPRSWVSPEESKVPGSPWSYWIPVSRSQLSGMLKKVHWNEITFKRDVQTTLAFDV